MPVLSAYASEMVRKLPGDLWRECAIASLTTTTIVSNELAVGGWSNDKFAAQYLWRYSTSTVADKSRYCTLFTSSSGTLTHAGASYSDTTATSENVIITKLEPYIVRKAIDVAIQRTKTIDRTELPINRSGGYSLGDFDWIRSPADIERICWSHDPKITRNARLQKRNSVNTSGVFQPDWFTVTSNADTTPWTATNYRGQKYYYNLERAGGTDAVLEQVVSALRSGVDGDWPVGETITAVCVCDPTTAGDLTLSIGDGTTTDTDTGSGAALQTITASITLAQAATDITLSVTAGTNNASTRIYELYAIVGTLDDPVAYDAYEEYPLNREDWDFDQNGVLTIKLPNIGRGQILVYSRRPYPGFDSARLVSGAADADETDAPLQVVVAGALSELTKAAASLNIVLPPPNPWKPEWTWEDEFVAQAKRHLYQFRTSRNDQVYFDLAPRARMVR